MGSFARVSWSIGLVVVAACAQAPRLAPELRPLPIAAAHPSAPSADDAASPVEAGAETRLSCTGDEVVVEIAPRVEVACFPERCPAPLRFRVASCSAEEVSFSTFSLSGPGNAAVSWELADPVVVRHGERSRLVEVTTSILGDTTFRVSTMIGGKPRTLESHVSFVDVRYMAERESCAASGGAWLQQGMLPPERCVDVMHDEGRRCVDSRDCTGHCELTKRTPLTKTTVRVEGRCTRYRTRFGCHTFIGETNGGIMPANAHFSRSCVD